MIAVTRATLRTARLMLPLAAMLLGLIGAQSAEAHAQLVGTSPASGATVATQPKVVIFQFNQNVGGTLGAVRVYNAQGEEVDNLGVSHPAGNEHWMGVGLRPGLPDGTYTATYRVVSADTHIVYGGLVFSIGHAGAAPKFTVAGLIGRSETGRVTKIAFGVVRVLDYLSIALMLGGLAFLVLVWVPGVGAVSSRGSQWGAAERAFARRMRLMLFAAIGLGFLASALGVLLQGATAAGVSLWASLKATVLENTLESRFGKVWSVRAIDWLIIGALVVIWAVLLRLAEAKAERGNARSASNAEAARAATDAPRGWLLGALVVCGAYLAVTPALGGHASVQSPTAIFFPADVLHVLASSVWVGGIACFVLAVPAATRSLEPGDRSRLLLAALARFSPLALASVVALAVTGGVQAYIDVRTTTGLFHSTYGALIIAKTLLLAVLVALGWVNRSRVIPALGRLVGAGESPGEVGVLARRTTRGELALMLCVFAVTAALVSYAPPIDAASGPFSTTTTLGPAVLEMTVEPAKVGLNTMHLYLIDAKTGTQFTDTKELTVTARLPSKGIGPLPLHASVAGPGHYIISSAVLSPGGTWEILLTDRVSEFESYARTIKVPIT